MDTEEILIAGIDIGTSTTQLIFSKIKLKNIGGFGKIPEIKIVSKDIIYKSDIYFTPLHSADEIDGPAVNKIIQSEYKKAKIAPDDLSTGAVIITGESSRKKNAKEVVDKLGVFEVRTKCANKNEMLLRPDWGRIFEADAQKKIKENCVKNPDVQIYFGDGLSAPSIGANIPDLFPTVKLGLEDRGIGVGTPFFVRYCRVNTARTIGPLVGAKITCVFIGERPGLLTDESMSAYIAYNARPEMSESDYTVVSNISRHGVPPVEAAAHIVDLMEEILKYKKSGVALSS